MTSLRRTGLLAALAVIALTPPLTGTAAAETQGDPDQVPDSAPGDSITSLNPPDFITGITPEDFIDELEVEESEGSTTTVTISADVLFEFDESTLTENARATLADHAEQLDGLTGTVEVVGHSDGIGDDDYNQRLSEERADAVKEAFEDELGDDAPEIEASGRGATEPVAEETGSDGEDDPGGRARNRRVEISFEST
jgi:OmpA-OmpF porin, OOP family